MSAADTDRPRRVAATADQPDAAGRVDAPRRAPVTADQPDAAGQVDARPRAPAAAEPVAAGRPDQPPQPAPAAGRPDGRPTGPAGHRGAVFGAAFTTLFALLLARNTALFSVAVHERGDAAANSILIGQAKQFHLLVGNYSRLGFAHPGPAFLYVQAFGEWLCHDVLGIVPTPWNGQALAVLALNAALVALALTVLAGWARWWPTIAVVAAVFLAYFAAYGQLIGTAWMPLMYFAPFLLLLTASASVAAGQVRDVPAVGLAAGFLVHGHAEFLFFVPVVACAAMTALVWPHRRSPIGLLRGYRRYWLILLGIVAVFALPVVLNLLLHWPGELPGYIGYARSDRAGGHRPVEVAEYVLRFWPGGTAAVSVIVALALLAGTPLLARLLPARIRRFALAGSAVVGLATLLFVGYVATGIDDLSQDYVGYFTRAIPLLAAALCVLGWAERAANGPASRAADPAAEPVAEPAVERTGKQVGDPAAERAVAAAGSADRPADRFGIRVIAAGLAVAGLAAAAASPTLVTPVDQIGNLPQVLDLLAARSADRPVVLTIDHDTWPELTALLVGGARRGMRLCVPDDSWRFMVTDEFLCGTRDLRLGERFRLDRAGYGDPGAVVLAVVGDAVLLDERPDRGSGD